MLPRIFVSHHVSLASFARLAVACVLLVSAAPVLAATPIPADASPAAALVQAALDAEQAGDADRRANLLAQALEADPDFAPARWHSGQVHFDGAWRKLTEIQNLVSHHRRWADYRGLRDSLAGTLEDHVTLAESCREHRLANEERFHWAVVLLAQPDHALALERLNLREFRGGLFTREQIATIEQDEADAEALRKRLLPQLRKVCREAMTGGPDQRAAALDAIRRTSDPAALPALHEAVAAAVQKSPASGDPLELAYIAALAKMPHHGATLRLLNHAVLSESAEARRVAAQSLRTRSQTDYVPLLMAALKAPIELDTSLFAAPDGTVHLSQTLFQPRPGADAEHTASLNLETVGALWHDPTKNNPRQVLAGHLAAAESAAANTRAAVDAANQQAALLNERIHEALRVAAEFDLSTSDPQETWESWLRHNELDVPDRSLVAKTQSDESYTFEYAQAAPRYPDPNVKVGYKHAPEGKMRVVTPAEMYYAPQTAWARFRQNPNFRPGMYAPSCFRAGTPVWTQAGPAPIEDVQLGDFVLAQHPETGEVAYRPVIAVTVRQPASVVAVRLRDEQIVATLGHRFWVAGQGWEMAKALAPQSQLHALGEPALVESIEQLSEKESCFNLVVDEFHTYFVGKSQLLVHDAECPRPVFVTLPGSKTTRDLAPTDGLNALSLIKR